MKWYEHKQNAEERFIKRQIVKHDIINTEHRQEKKIEDTKDMTGHILYVYMVSHE